MLTYGRYEIIEEIGRGSMGIVYLAKDPQIDRRLALKVIRKNYAHNTYFLSRFHKEAKAIGRLSHPNIVTVYDIGKDHGTQFIAMEFIAGKPLRKIIQSQTMSLAHTVEIGLNLAKALDYAHRKGIVHRDVKPSNIILSESGDPILTDFGLAHLDDPEAVQQTRVGEVMGTPRYMSPEQVLGQKVDHRSDLYALGVILYELSTGRNLIEGKNLSTIFNSIIHDVPKVPKIRDPDAKAEQRRAFSRILSKCLAKRPQDRIQTGRQLAEALAGCKIGTFPKIANLSSETMPIGRFSFQLAVLIILFASASGAAWWLKKGSLWQATKPGTEISHAIHAPAEISSTTDSVRPNEQAQKRWAALEIRSEPEGAQVLIDGVVKGRAPLSVKLPLGEYQVVLRMRGHFDWQTGVDLKGTAPKPISATLVPLVF